MRPFRSLGRVGSRRRSLLSASKQTGPVLTDHARLWLATLIMAAVALTVAWAATAPAEGDPIPTPSIRSR